MLKHFNITIRGKVQGVWYRASAQQAGQRFGLVGFVKNLPDGGVYCEAEGSETALNDFVVWCRRGPELARVETVDTVESAILGFSGFEIRR
ncbi:MAG: acylphosphatase [Saprospiraceae bacterium]|nr:acylphosphatase [Saprospiraceae bacterium]MCF8252758.1 acylphosphatase [Saprospiraceae bacterium]MCF8283130.1 acylphosphatase [Bacteroidales bacterium]MCF8314306.1 acylphosphatase [Saprospiraceae bacterium]MCF8443185.1 acylphosphatase [Saprospiraceae bacterium]